MDIDREALLAVFLPQAEEGLGSMEEALLGLELNPQDEELLDEVFRVAHTLKGDADMVGFPVLASTAHRLEDRLESLRSGELTTTPELVTRLLRIVDGLRQQLVAESEGSSQPVAALERAMETLEQELGPSRSEEDEAVVFDPPEAEQAADPMGGEGETTKESEGNRLGVRAHQQRTLRVETEKLDQLISLTGEITVARGRLSQMIEDPEIHREGLLQELQEADRLYLELHELAMRLRMVAVGPTFHGFARLVRDATLSSDKLARLHVVGSDVEVDNSVLQLLKEPLTHMIRNAIDHGIESPAERRAKGKKVEGKITLSARHSANRIVIEVEDDGAGLHRERILDRARELGRVAEDQELAEDLGDLLFEPGFSTSQKVTQLSGRGVGLDVVRRNVSALRGDIRIHSEKDRGTRVVLQLPLTLAIIEGLLVAAGDEIYVVPIDSILETTDLVSDDSPTQPRGCFNLRGSPVPYVRLRHIFGIDGDPAKRENVIVVQVDDGIAGLVVDGVLGKNQVVVKPLAKVFQTLRGLSGCTILGSGNVALILDAVSLLRDERGQTAAAEITLPIRPRTVS